MFEYATHSMRIYGQPKLSKPKELKGLRPICSIPFSSTKCKCQVFIVENDMWIKHNDFFSSDYKSNSDKTGQNIHELRDEVGVKQINKKFIYADSWGSMILRNQAYIVLKNIVPFINKIITPKLVTMILIQMAEYHGIDVFKILVGDWQRFYDNVINTIIKTNNIAQDTCRLKDF